MFKLVDSSTFWWPIRLEEPIDGKHRTAMIQGEFAQLSQAEIDELLARDGDDAAGEGQGKLAERVLVGWKGVCSEDGEEMEFTEDARDSLLSIPWARRAVIMAFLKSQAGKEAKRGN